MGLISQVRAANASERAEGKLDDIYDATERTNKLLEELLKEIKQLNQRVDSLEKAVISRTH